LEEGVYPRRHCRNRVGSLGLGGVVIHALRRGISRAIGWLGGEFVRDGCRFFGAAIYPQHAR
jgi:glycerate kinase